MRNSLPDLSFRIRNLQPGALVLMYTGFGIGYGPIVFILQGVIFFSEHSHIIIVIRRIAPK